MIDVLIIGSGGAGLSSALKAKRMEVGVLVVSKNANLFTNCTSAGGYKCCFI